METKPLIVRLDDAKTELAQCVNDTLQKHGLNCYLIEPLFAELYSQIKMTAKQELAQARSQMSATEVASKK